jgi:enhancing lycopene biosynthesis protein 2
MADKKAHAKKTVGVVLSGAGFLDGSEIHEAVLCLLAIDELGAEARIVAPKMPFAEVDHLAKRPTGKERDVLCEAARIARGRVTDITGVKGTDVDGWVLPGGYGAAKNLCDFAVKGPQATPHKEVARVVREAFAAKIPVGACCIAPALLATIARSSGTKLKLTIGDDAGTASALTAMGAVHQSCPVDAVVVDAEHRVVTAPAYMYDAPISKVATGIRKMVQQVLEWA